MSIEKYIPTFLRWFKMATHPVFRRKSVIRTAICPYCKNIAGTEQVSVDGLVKFKCVCRTHGCLIHPESPPAETKHGAVSKWMIFIGRKWVQYV